MANTYFKFRPLVRVLDEKYGVGTKYSKIPKGIREVGWAHLEHVENLSRLYGARADKAFRIIENVVLATDPSKLRARFQILYDAVLGYKSSKNKLPGMKKLETMAREELVRAEKSKSFVAPPLRWELDVGNGSRLSQEGVYVGTNRKTLAL